MAEQRRFGLPRAYKLALALAVVIGPLYWLMFTADGQRRMDLFVLNLMGRHGFNVAFERLDPRVTEADLRAQFPRVDLACDAAGSPFGDRACSAKIASYNGVPARSVNLYLQGEQLRALHLVYEPRYHHLLAAELRDQHGDPVEQSTTAQPVMRWQLPGGALLLPAEDVDIRSDAALIWLSRQVDGADG
jgi:hypothetical protein